MTNKITAITLHTTAFGEQMAITYGTIDDEGNVVATNRRADMIVLSEEGLSAIETLNQIALNKINSID